MLNHIVIMGRLTRDPELRRTGTGIAVANFTLAVDRDFKGQNGEKETDFIDCVAWRNTAEFVAKYFTKGSMAVVSGRLTIRGWTDKDGSKRRTAEVVAENVYFGETKRDSGAAPADYSGQAAAHPQSGFPETEAMLARHGVNSGYAQPNYQQGDFAMLEDDDAQLPF